MSPKFVVGRFERGERARGTNRVKTVQHLRFQVYFQSLTILTIKLASSSLKLLRPVGKSIAAAVQACLVECIDFLNAGYGMFWWIATAVVVHIDQITTMAALTLGNLVRLDVRYPLKYFWYTCLRRLWRDVASDDNYYDESPCATQSRTLLSADSLRKVCECSIAASSLATFCKWLSISRRR